MSALQPNICKAMTADALQRLRQAGVITVTDFLSRDKEELAQSCGIAFKDIVSISRVLLAQFSAHPVSGLVLYTNLLSNQSIISSGFPSLDEVLDGGYYAGELCELAGEPASGKTQMVVRCAVMLGCVQGHRTVFVDTGGSFCAQSTLRLIPDTAIDKMKILSKISTFQAFDVYSLMNILHQLRHDLKRQSDVKLIIIDCVATVFSPILGGQQMDSLALIEQLGLQVKQIAADFNVVVLVTNNVTASMERERQPSLGRVWAHAPHTRILLERGIAHGDISLAITATVIKSARVKTGIATQVDLSSLLTAVQK